MKKSLLLAIILWFALLAAAVPCSASVNLLQNGSFEEGEQRLSSWDQDMWRSAGLQSVMEASDLAHTGKRSARIVMKAENDARWIQRVKVKPETLYRLSGYILVEKAGASAKGANLSVLEGPSTSQDFKDTNGQWKLVELYGRTGPGQNELTVAARIGGFGSLNTGTAYFDDLALEETDSAPSGVPVVSFYNEKPAGEGQKTPTTSGTPFKLIFFALLFFVLYAAAYELLFRQKRLEKASPWQAGLWMGVLLAGAFVLRLLIAPGAEGYMTDLKTFQAWAHEAATRGLSQFYASSSFADYPPGYMYVLYVLGKWRIWLGLGFGTPASYALLKLPAMLADIAISYGLYRMAKPKLGVSAAIGLSLLFAYNPAVIVNSAVWGQVDSFFTLFLLGTLASAVRGRLKLAGVLFALTVLIKPQALIFTPVLLYLYYRKGSWKTFALSILYGAAAFAAGVLPFAVHMKPLWVIRLYLDTLSSYPYATLNAFNFFALTGGNWKNQNEAFLYFSYQAWGMAFIAAAVAASVYFFVRSRKKDHPGLYYFIAFLLISAVFLFGVRMHERYWYPALALVPALFIHLRDRRLLRVILVLSASQFMNVAYVLAESYSNTFIPHTDGILLSTSALSLLLFGYSVKIGYDGFIANRVLPVLDPEEEARLTSELAAEAADREASAAPGKRRWFSRTDWLLMGGLTLIYAVVALIHLGSLKAPQTHWEPAVSGESFVVDFGAVKKIDRINSFAEIGDGKIRLEFAKDRPDQWTGPENVEIKYTSVFTWTVLKAPKEARYVKISVFSAGFTLNELAFYEKDGNSPIPVTSISDQGMTPPVRGSVANLFDEPGDSFYSPTYMDGTYFDEIYHARTAYEHLHDMKPYENTHPPLGKLLIAIGIKLFGMNPFGWRIIGTLFGIGMVPLMYVFGKRLFGKTEYAFMASFLMTFDFMHFAQTRIATIDTYGVFFIILMYYYMYRYMSMSFYRVPLRKTLKPLFLSGLFFGIGAASKWIVIYGGAGLAVLFFAALFRRYREFEAARKELAVSGDGLEPAEKSYLTHITRVFISYTVKTILWCVPFFVAIPGLIYSVSFLPYMTIPGEHISLHNLIHYQLVMWDYHSKLVATHAFSSPWWEWPIIARPIWFYSGKAVTPEGQVSSIVSMGNPAVWWLGTIAVILAIALAWRRRDRGMALVLTAFFSQYLPWVLITRLTFIYHFFAMVPFLVLSIVYVFRVLNEEYRLKKSYNYVYMGIVLVLFMMFYPVLSGALVDRLYVQIVLRWFQSWIFYS